MDNSKKLTPEEIMDIHIKGDNGHPIYDIHACMKQYAAQEVAEKDALLKDARLLLYDARSRLQYLAVSKRISPKNNPLESRILDFLDRTRPYDTADKEG